MSSRARSQLLINGEHDNDSNDYGDYDDDDDDDGGADGDRSYESLILASPPLSADPRDNLFVTNEKGHDAYSNLFLKPEKVYWEAIFVTIPLFMVGFSRCLLIVPIVVDC
jgi:hypothetical protein